MFKVQIEKNLEKIIVNIVVSAVEGESDYNILDETGQVVKSGKLTKEETGRIMAIIEPKLSLEKA